MISILLNALKIIFLLGFLIFIHELGHFLVAKLCKVKVKEFAIGFGPTIWKRQGKETRYAIRAIPLGGFVKMLGEEEHSEEEGSFSKASVPKRIAIVLAGGFVNIILGVLIYFILMTSSSTYYSTRIDEVYDNYSAKESGIIANDEILEINGKRTRFVSDINEEVLASNGEEITIKIKRDNNIKYITLKPTKEIQKNIGVYFGTSQDENLSAEIKGIYENSPAEKSQILVGDIIKKIDNIDVNDNPYEAVELISNSKNEKIKVEILRNNELLEIDVEPTETTSYKIGVSFKIAEKNFGNNIYYAFWDTCDFVGSIMENLKEMFSGKVSVDQLTGPVGISEMVSKTKGIIEFVYMLALISLSLGITNLLPFPPLDGGKFVFLIIEAIRRKPLKESTELKIQLLGFVLLITLSIYVTYNDITKIF